ncbi:MAG: hypothetical protein E6J88_13890 [Deltaproteobacteria bacterium]|nr:MAG: hypothetical protein E6J88_13890 [Deltaproteobacteria bacterium]
MTRASNGDALAGTTATFFGFNLILNGSFEIDTAGPPAGWTSTGSSGNPPKAYDATSRSVAPAPLGNNVAGWDSLTTTYSGRGALSSCFAIPTGNGAVVSASFRSGAGAPTLRLTFHIYTTADCSGTDTAIPESSGTPASTTAWASHSFSRTSAQLGTTTSGVSARVEIQAHSNATGDIAYFDNVVVNLQ